MEKLEMQCRFKCGERFKLNSRQSHENVCPLTPLPCSLECGQKIARRDFASHEPECSEKVVACSCGLLVKQGGLKVS